MGKPVSALSARPMPRPPPGRSCWSAGSWPQDKLRLELIWGAYYLTCMKQPSFVVQPARLVDVVHLFEEHHAYKSISATSTYCFGVVEDGRYIAAFTWQPPPPGAALSVCSEAPYAVLALSRMVAVPRAERRLRHISKPLRYQMLRLIDRGRWPVLVTYSDEGLGHLGHVYKCSGWTPTTRKLSRQFVGADGTRTSVYRNGRMDLEGLKSIGSSFIQRWEHWACSAGAAAAHVETAGWFREPIPGKTWRSGAQACRWVKHQRGQTETPNRSPEP